MKQSQLISQVLAKMKSDYRNRAWLAKKLHINPKRLSDYLDGKITDEKITTALQIWLEK